MCLWGVDRRAGGARSPRRGSRLGERLERRLCVRERDAGLCEGCRPPPTFAARSQSFGCRVLLPLADRGSSGSTCRQSGAGGAGRGREAPQARVSPRTPLRAPGAFVRRSSASARVRMRARSFRSSGRQCWRASMTKRALLRYRFTAISPSQCSEDPPPLEICIDRRKLAEAGRPHASGVNLSIIGNVQIHVAELL